MSPQSITKEIVVPLKYHHVISRQGAVFRTLKSFGVQVDQSIQPQRVALPSRPLPTVTPSARIDDFEGNSASPEFEWEVITNYQDAEEGDSIWTLGARDQEGLEKAEKAIADSIASAERMSHVGFLTLPDRSSFPRIVGSKGANVARLRNETGADITVSRENNTIVIIGQYPPSLTDEAIYSLLTYAGAEGEIKAAKEAIIRMASNGNRGPRRYHD